MKIELIGLISEFDKKIHIKAKKLGISEHVFSIQNFLEKVTEENPVLQDYNVLGIKQVKFGDIDVKQTFFDSFREDYKEFNIWFSKKSEESCYVCYDEDDIVSFLFIKIEKEDENYIEITPTFQKKKRLKIGTLKVASNGYKIGERFLKIIFDNAVNNKVEEIYVTLFNKRPEQEQLIKMLGEWGFQHWGSKKTENGSENVYIRIFNKNNANIQNPKLTFPFIASDKVNKYLIFIEPEYHTELFPDSITKKEDNEQYKDNFAHRNRISKTYISHAQRKSLQSGDIIVIYRNGETKPKRYSSTVTTICIVENMKDGFKNFDDFFNHCNKRTMFSKDELLKNWWDKYSDKRPFIINLLYAHALPTPKLTLNDLLYLKIIKDIYNMPRGIHPLSDEK